VDLIACLVVYNDCLLNYMRAQQFIMIDGTIVVVFSSLWWWSVELR